MSKEEVMKYARKTVERIIDWFVEDGNLDVKNIDVEKLTYCMTMTFVICYYAKDEVLTPSMFEEFILSAKKKYRDIERGLEDETNQKQKGESHD